MGGAGGYLEMNVYKPLMIFNIMNSIVLLADGCANFRKFMIEGTRPNVRTGSISRRCGRSNAASSRSAGPSVINRNSSDGGYFVVLRNDTTVIAVER